MNSPFRETLMQDYKRLIVWASSGAPHPNILSLQDMPKIAADGHFFARKFDAGTDRAVIDALLARLRTGTAA